MTTLASVDTTSAASILPRVRRSGGAFSPVLGTSMSDNHLGAGGGVGGVSSNAGGRWKRELEPGDGQEPPPAKRMSPVPLRPHDKDAHQGTCARRLDSSRPADPSSLRLGDAAMPGSRGAFLRGRTWQSSPFRTEGGGGGGGGAHTLPPARETALGIGRAHTTSPVKAMATAVASTRPSRASTLVGERPSSPPQLWEKAASVMTSGEPLHRPYPVPTQRGGGLGPKPSSPSPSPLMVGGCRRDVLKPAAAKRNIGVSLESGGGGGGGDKLAAEALPPGRDGNSCKSMKRPLGGGLRASSSWDGGCASSAPPGSGGGFSATPACRACGGGNSGEFGDSCEGREACSCKGVRPSSTTCLSPLPFGRGISSESGGAGQETRRHLLGDDDMFSDHILSHALSLSTCPAVGPQIAASGRSGSGSAAGAGGAGVGGDVEGLEIMMPGDMHDIEDCMRTLQASPTHAGSHPEHAPSLHTPLGFDISSFDGAANHHDEPPTATGMNGDDSRDGGAGEMAVETASSHLNGGHLLGEDNVELAAIGGESGPRVGDDHQAVIPNLSSRDGQGNTRLSPPRPPPLQLWRPGVLSQVALGTAFRPPRPEGGGSADLEQKMLSAYLVAQANAFERCVRDSAVGGGRSDGAVAAGSSTGVPREGLLSAAAGHGSAVGGGVGGGAVVMPEDRASSLESLAAFVAEGEGSRWRSDWPEKDRAAFRRGVFAFRRDFHRIRAAFLPRKEHGDVVEYFYRRWKTNPEYSAWKCTEQLIGRRVAKCVEVREGAGVARRFETLGMRRGWVVRKDLTSGLDQMFVVRFPRMGTFPMKMESVDLGTLETMLVEGSATEEERASEALDGVRVAQSRSDIVTGGGVGGRGGGSGGGGAWFSNGRAYDSELGGGSHHLNWRPAVAGAHQGAGRGRLLGWNSGPDSGDEDDDEDARASDDDEEQEGERGQGQGPSKVWAEARGASGMHDEDKEEEDEEEEGETEEAEVDEGGGTSDSVSGPDAETDSTASMGGAAARLASSSASLTSSASLSAGPQPVFVPREPLQQARPRISSQPHPRQPEPHDEVHPIRECWDIERPMASSDASGRGAVR